MWCAFPSSWRKHFVGRQDRLLSLPPRVIRKKPAFFEAENLLFVSRKSSQSQACNRNQRQ